MKKFLIVLIIALILIDFGQSVKVRHQSTLKNKQTSHHQTLSSHAALSTSLLRLKTFAAKKAGVTDFLKMDAELSKKLSQKHTSFAKIKNSMHHFEKSFGLKPNNTDPQQEQQSQQELQPQQGQQSQQDFVPNNDQQDSDGDYRYDNDGYYDDYGLDTDSYYDDQGFDNDGYYNEDYGQDTDSYYDYYGSDNDGNYDDYAFDNQEEYIPQKCASIYNYGGYWKSIQIIDSYYPVSYDCKNGYIIYDFDTWEEKFVQFTDEYSREQFEKDKEGFGFYEGWTNENGDWEDEFHEPVQSEDNVYLWLTEFDGISVTIGQWYGVQPGSGFFLESINCFYTDEGEQCEQDYIWQDDETLEEWIGDYLAYEGYYVWDSIQEESYFVGPTNIDWENLDVNQLGSLFELCDELIHYAQENNGEVVKEDIQSLLESWELYFDDQIIEQFIDQVDHDESESLNQEELEDYQRQLEDQYYEQISGC